MAIHWSTTAFVHCEKHHEGVEAADAVGEDEQGASGHAREHPHGNQWLEAEAVSAIPSENRKGMDSRKKRATSPAANSSSAPCQTIIGMMWDGQAGFGGDAKGGGCE